MKLPGTIAALALALAGCGTTAPEGRDFVPGYPGVDYLPAERMAGELTLGFEVSRFEECWFEMTGDAARRFREVAPEAQGRGPYRYRIEMMARRAPAAAGRTFGHLGAYPCQVRASRFLSVQRVRTRR